MGGRPLRRSAVSLGVAVGRMVGPFCPTVGRAVGRAGAVAPEELADALVELMRRREEQMDRDSRRPEARNSAHAA